MTKAMPFLQKVILLSYDPRPFAVGSVKYAWEAIRTAQIPQNDRSGEFVFLHFL